MFTIIMYFFFIFAWVFFLMFSLHCVFTIIDVAVCSLQEENKYDRKSRCRTGVLGLYSSLKGEHENNEHQRYKHKVRPEFVELNYCIAYC